MSEHTKETAGRFIFLDYLRIFAFLSVLLGHKFAEQVVAFSLNEGNHATARALAGMLVPLIQGGGAGVVVFFIVSGYIITHVLQQESPIQFAIKRVFRIYPLYVIAVLLEYSLGLLGGQGRDKWTLLAQLTLMGDFFGTPNSLGSVDWTLRIEVLFYAFMTVLSATKIIKGDGRAVALIMVAATVVLGVLSPFPNLGAFNTGYLNLYGPFLLVGSMVYLAENKRIGFGVLFWFVVLVLNQYFALIERIQPHWLNVQFAALSCMIFGVAWACRRRFTHSALFAGLSELTFAVYLFHNWLYDAIVVWLSNLKIVLMGKEADALTVLFAICFFAVRLIERPAVRAGRAIAMKLGAQRRNQSGIVAEAPSSRFIERAQ